MARQETVLSLCMALSLVGCGGGGGGQQTPPPGNTGTPDGQAFVSCLSRDSFPAEAGAPVRLRHQADTRLRPLAGGVTLSGVIDIADGSAVDIDVNDPSTSVAFRNNTFVDAQALGNPSLTGGFINAPGLAPRHFIDDQDQIGFIPDDANTAALGDLNDFYRANLIAGQRVVLNIADPDEGDLDVCLFDHAGLLVDASRGIGELESLTVPADGDYYVEVYVFRGYSNYVLALGQELAVAAETGSLRLSADIVPGKTRMQWRNPPLDDGQRRLAAAAVGMQRSGGFGERWEVLHFGDPGGGLRRQAATALKAPATGIGPEHPASRAGLAGQWNTLTAIKLLAAREDVAFAEPVYRVRALAVPNDQHYAKQWHYPLIELPLAWDLLPDGIAAPPVVAVVDTGIVSSHPDLVGQTVTEGGRDFISDPVIAADGDGRDDNPEDPGDQSPGGSSFHGTHVAGTIAAASDNGIGVAGVTWGTGARILPLRVLGVGGGESTDVDAALLYAAGLDTPNTARRADVVNLSLGGSRQSLESGRVLADVKGAGVIVIAAAGNDASSAPSFPAADPSVVSVSAVAPDQSLAYYSNFGSTIDVAAPGGDNSGDRDGDGFPDGVLSTSASDTDGPIRSTYAFQNGTSMAAPHVAGVAALMKAVNPALTPEQFDSLLANGLLTDDIGASGRDDFFGHGLINARKAVLAALDTSSGEPLPARLLAVTSALNFGTTQNSLELRLRNSGGLPLDLTGISSNATWLSPDPLTVTRLQPGEQISVTIRVDRGALAEGSFQANIQITSSNNTVNVPVLIQIGGPGGGGDQGFADAGFHYVLLLQESAPDSGIFNPVQQVAVAASGGRYEFSFTDVPPGRYQIVAGSDADYDNFICDDGEACGAYLSLDQPAVILVDAANLVDQAGLDFFTGYRVHLSLRSQAAADGRGFGGYPLAVRP